MEVYSNAWLMPDYRGHYKLAWSYSALLSDSNELGDGGDKIHDCSYSMTLRHIDSLLARQACEVVSNHFVGLISAICLVVLL